MINLFGVAVSNAADAVENMNFLLRPHQEGVRVERRRVLGEALGVIQGCSIVKYARSGTHPCVHTDASHPCENVLGDIPAAEKLVAGSSGVVVFGDFRTLHARRMAAAVWGEVAKGQAEPFALTPMRSYATWGELRPHIERVSSWVADSAREWGVQRILGVKVVGFGAVDSHGMSYNGVKRWVPEVAWLALARMRRILGR